MGVSPLIIILPVALLQAVGLVEEDDVILGVGLITTVVLPGEEGQLPVVAVAITVYTPAIAVVLFGMVGFCAVLVYPFGPVHDQVTAIVLVVLANNLIVESLQSGELFVAVGVAGLGFITTVVFPVSDLQFAMVAIAK